MDYATFTDDVWDSIGNGLYTDQAGDLCGPSCQIITIGETWQGALYGVEENSMGQRYVHRFDTEDDQRAWFDAVTFDL